MEIDRGIGKGIGKDRHQWHGDIPQQIRREKAAFESDRMASCPRTINRQDLETSRQHHLQNTIREACENRTCYSHKVTHPPRAADSEMHLKEHILKGQQRSISCQPLLANMWSKQKVTGTSQEVRRGNNAASQRVISPLVTAFWQMRTKRQINGWSVMQFTPWRSNQPKSLDNIPEVRTHRSNVWRVG